MTLFVLAVGGLGLVVAFVRYGRTILRWALRATAVTAGLFLYLAMGHMYPVIGYAGYVFPLAAGAWIFRHRLALHLPWAGRHLIERFPRRKQKVLERAFKDEIDQEGKRVVPKVTSWERFDG